MNDFSLYLITDRHQTGDRGLTDVVREALDGGIRAVQLREKDLSGAELFRMASELRRLTAEYEARLLINDRVDIAVATDADGVHLGIAGMPVPEARKLLGSNRIICYSAHSVDEAQQAEVHGADAVTFGPVYHTPSKAAFGSPCGVGKLKDAVSSLRIPVIALGGISIQNVQETLASHVRGVAVISAILAAAEPRAAASALLKKIKEHAQHL